MAGSVRGSAVLVHGLWGNPDDWQWVRSSLEAAGVRVTVPDLPSHLSTEAGLTADAKAVRHEIRSGPAPVVAVGWSYGGTVISVAAAGEPSVRHLVYVSDVPSPPQTESAG
ncbi:MAG TPA: alpha/beta hydrolase, partial [Propionibacteriaceae bacterium]|nr:alpha/beta hydrolase [Propionibacteriaceae bacterium]